MGQKHSICPCFISSIKHASLNWFFRKKHLEDEAKEFYLRACIENHYSKRELERQIDSMLYERTAISDAKYGQLAKRNEGLSTLRDAYVLEFLDLPASYKEKDLRKQIVSHLKDFILEFGRDFSFIGEEYRL